jgi:hypothetical protein
MDNYYGYNCTKGGEGISGYKYTEEQRKKMSERQKGYKPRRTYSRRNSRFKV